MFRVYYVCWPIILPTDVYGDLELGSDPPSYVPLYGFFMLQARVQIRGGAGKVSYFFLPDSRSRIRLPMSCVYDIFWLNVFLKVRMGIRGWARKFCM